MITFNGYLILKSLNLTFIFRNWFPPEVHRNGQNPESGFEKLTGTAILIK